MDRRTDTITKTDEPPMPAVARLLNKSIATSVTHACLLVHYLDIFISKVEMSGMNSIMQKEEMMFV